RCVRDRGPVGRRRRTRRGCLSHGHRPAAERGGRGWRRGRERRAGSPPRPGGAGMIRVAVAGAAGRMGETVCDAVQGADDMELVGRADPVLGTTLEEVLPDAEVVVDFTLPDTALENALACMRA